MIAIVGAGISGLFLGYSLKRKGVTDFIILEKENRVGGKIGTEKWENISLELGPNTLMLSEELEELISNLGLKEKMIFPEEEMINNRFIKKNGSISLLPSKPQKLLFSNLLSIKSKLSIFKDLRFKPQKVNPSESVSDFFTKHFTEEIVDTFVSPFCRGIYGSEPSELILKNTFPKLAEIQKTYGSVIKGLSKSSTKRRVTFTFDNGVNTLCEALQNELKDHIFTGENISITKADERFEIKTNQQTINADKIVLSCSANACSAFTSSFDKKTSNLLNNISYSRLNVEHRIYEMNDEFPYKGFGVLYPQKESKNVLGHIWKSNLTPNENKHFLITTMHKSTDNQSFHKELSSLLEKDYNLKEENLIHKYTQPWEQAIPVYNKEHNDFLEQYKELEKINLYFCSNLVNGVSIPDRLTDAIQLAEKIKQ